MGEASPEKFWHKIIFYVCVSGFALPLGLTIYYYHKIFEDRLIPALKPKHKNLNWLRKLAGIPPK